MEMYKIQGTGIYFGEFYVKAESLPSAIAQARDILRSALRCDLNGEDSLQIDKHLTSVTLVV